MRLRATSVVVSILCGVVALTTSAMFADGVVAATPGPAWEISSVAHRTNFSMEDNAKCARISQPLCDQYLVTLTNVGEAATHGLVTIVDTLPQGLIPVSKGGVFEIGSAS